MPIGEDTRKALLRQGKERATDRLDEAGKEMVKAGAASRRGRAGAGRRLKKAQREFTCAVAVMKEWEV